jgi:putative tryptophan/tyrosine transport system substrate-binding protein
MSDMRRREFITLLGGAAVAWPLAARGQQPGMPVVGFLRSASLADATHLVDAFRQGLKEIGYIEGRNVAIEYRSADNDPDRLRALAMDFARRPVAVIVGNVLAAIAAKAVTSTVPIVFATGTDPVRDGLVSSLNRPGGNVTGASFFAARLGAKRLELLRQLVPTATKVAVLVAPASDAMADRQDLEAAAQTIGQQLEIYDVAADGDIEAGFRRFVARGAGALIVVGGAFMFSNRERLVALAARHTLPASYPLREFVSAGGLMSYAPGITEAYHQVGIYAGRILKGEKPGNLPVMQSTKFELVLNLKTAKALGLQIPDKLLALADEVIE